MPNVRDLKRILLEKFRRLPHRQTYEENDREFRDHMRRMIRQLDRHETSEEDEELARLRYDDPGVQRRIADLVNKIAERRENTDRRTR